MTTPCKDIATILDGVSSLGLVLGTGLYWGQLPDTPTKAIAITDNPSTAPLLQLVKSRSNYFFSSVTVWSRDVDYDTAYDAAFAILEYLHGESNITVDDTIYVLIKAIGEPQLLHFDENGRPVFITNYEVHRKPVTVN